MVEGIVYIPPASIIDERGLSIPTVQLSEFLHVDQQIKSWIFATLYRDVFVDVHKLSTSVEIWTRLQSRFMQASMGTSIELKGRLTRIKKTAS